MSALIKHNGVWKEPDVIYVRDGGVWKEVSGKRFVPGEPMYGGFFGGLAAYTSGTIFALIIADKSVEVSRRWKSTRTNTSGTASDTNGLANSNSMNNSSHPAAKYCLDLVHNDYDDWYLGAPDEYKIISVNLAPTLARTGFLAPDFYSGGPQALPTYLWTSRSGTMSYAYRMTTSSASITATAYKDSDNPVRPIRRMAVSI